MTDYEFPSAPEIEAAYRTAYKALAALVPPETVDAEEEMPFVEVLSGFGSLVDLADLATVGQLGPRVSWQGPRLDDGSWQPIVAGLDLDDDVHDFGVELDASAFEGPTGRWPGSALERAALVYKRACGWDFPPGEAGVWLLMLAPTRGFGADDSWSYSGHVVGFVIVYDRDGDGSYESVGHIWTAAAWQRQGIARRLLSEARSRFPVTRVEEPYTSSGRMFLAACPEGEERVAAR